MNTCTRLDKVYLRKKYRSIMIILISDIQYRNDIPPMMNDNLSCHDDCIKNTRKTKQRTTGWERADPTQIWEMSLKKREAIKRWKIQEPQQKDAKTTYSPICNSNGRFRIVLFRKKAEKKQRHNRPLENRIEAVNEIDSIVPNFWANRWSSGFPIFERSKVSCHFGLNCIFARPFSSCGVVPGTVCLVNVGNLRHQWVVGVGVCEHGADRQENCVC